jgi:hypothetical protein
LAVDSQAFLDELVCLPLIGVVETILTAFCSSALWQIYETLYLLFRVQECRFTTPSWDAGIIVLSMGMGYSPICPLGLQTQQNHIKVNNRKQYNIPWYLQIYFLLF